MSYKKILHFAREMRKNPTPAEAFFWDKMRKQKFMNYKFRRQHIIRHSVIMNKEYFYITDFYCHELMLIIELDGKIHQYQKEYDQIREEILKEMGYTIIRFQNETVLNKWQTVKQELADLLQALASRA